MYVYRYWIFRFAASSAIKQFDNTGDTNYSRTKYQKLMQCLAGHQRFHNLLPVWSPTKIKKKSL